MQSKKKSTTTFFFVIGFFLFTSFTAYAAVKIDAKAIHPLFKTANWGAYVIDAEAGTVIYSRNASKLFIPASITKLFTTATALENLSPSDAFYTRIEATSAPDADGTIFGHLYLVGGADPTLSTEGIRDLAKRVYDAGVRVIHGKVLSDISLFEGSSLSLHAEWEDLWMNYCPEETALCVNRNVVELSIQPAQNIDEEAQIELKQDVIFCQVINKVKTVAASEKSSISISRGLNDNIIEISGKIAVASEAVTKFVAIHSPHNYATMIFNEALQNLGISIQDNEYEDSSRIEIAGISSSPVSTIIHQINKISDNLSANLLYKYLNVKFGGEVRPLDNLMKSLSISQDTYQIYDGSGLSRHNVISPKQTMKLLKRILKASYRDVLLDSLPVAGTDDSLKNRFLNRESGIIVKGKTGGMQGISNLAGLAEMPSGKKILFAIFVNNSLWSYEETSNALDTLLLAILKANEQPAQEVEPA